MSASFAQRFRLRPAELIIASFAAVILVGTGLLLLPQATRGGGLSVVDALFTATSAVCVTGLVVVDTGSYFTAAGQLIILGLIQVGGLGIITLSAFLFYLFKGHMSMRNRETILRTVAGRAELTAGGFLKRVVSVAVVVELLGTVALTLAFARTHGLGEAFYLGLFHAVSAFCNAGFSLFPDSLAAYGADVLVNLTVMLLIVVGGLGFAVLLELRHALKAGHGLARLSIHSRVVLSTSGILIVLGALAFFLGERDNTLRGMPWWTQVTVSLFQSVTSRTAGFNTVELGHLANVTLFVLMMLMFVGGASGSCAGGIKVNTFTVMVAMFWGRLHGRTDINLCRRRMSQSTLTRALSVSILSFLLITGVLMLLLTTELGEISHVQSRGRFLELAFETTSAFGTVGLSTGVTAGLSTVGRLVVTLLMFAGRVGPLTLATLLHARRPPSLRYPEEDMIIG